MQEQYRPPISANFNSLQSGAEYNAPLKAKGFFERLPHQRRIIFQKTRHRLFQSLAADMAAFCSRLVADMCFQFRAISGGGV